MGCGSSDLSYLEEEDERYASNSASNSASTIDRILCENPRITYSSSSKPVGANHNRSMFVAYLGSQKVALHRINESKFKEVQHEMLLVSQLNHESVIRYLFEYKYADIPYVVTEFFEKTLEAYVGEDVYNSQSNNEDLMWQLVEVIEYLQSLKIVVLNLLPQNIFVVQKNSEPVVKLTDFSCAIKIQENPSKITGYYPANKTFAAPEIYGSTIAYLSSDLYPLGCTLYFLFSNGKMFNNEKQFKNMIALKGSNVTSSDYLCIDLIRKLLSVPLQRRLTIEEMVQHPLGWNNTQTTNFIIALQVKIEEGDANLRSCLFKNSHFVVGFNEQWTSRIEVNILEELNTIRKDFKAKNKSNVTADTDKKDNIISLIRTMRNLLVHPQPDQISALMGTPSLFLDYWLTKFPSLIMHLYNSKSNYENGIF